MWPLQISKNYCTAILCVSEKKTKRNETKQILYTLFCESLQDILECLWREKKSGLPHSVECLESPESMCASAECILFAALDMVALS